MVYFIIKFFISVKKYFLLFLHVYLLKFIYIFTYYLAHFFKKEYNLEKRNILFQYYRNTIYLHPEDENKFIIISHSKNLFDSNVEIYRFNLLNLNLSNTKYKDFYLPKYYGRIRTNKGIGLVYDLIRDFDNSISIFEEKNKTFAYIEKKISNNLSKKYLLNNYANLFNYYN